LSGIVAYFRIKYCSKASLRGKPVKATSRRIPELLRQNLEVNTHSVLKIRNLFYDFADIWEIVLPLRPLEKTFFFLLVGKHRVRSISWRQYFAGSELT
jgi:hypothetical protein